MQKIISFIDTEIGPNSKKILDLGGIKSDGKEFHRKSIPDFIYFMKDSEYVCGHNIFKFDLNYIGNTLKAIGITKDKVIDTLYISPLLFPSRPYHALLKDDKLQTDELNNPLNDSIKAKDLFYDEVTAFIKLDDDLKRIYYYLLNNQKEFHAFFTYLNYTADIRDIDYEIRKRFHNQICEHANISSFISDYPIELSYCLSLINTKSRYSITPRWVLKNYPDVERIMYLLRNKPCLEGCNYCNEALDAIKGLKRFFGYDSYRTFNGQALQEKAVKAAINNKSLLAVFPTGGGKSITFQVPALMSGMTAKGLTVVISPLQSLMKDQVDNLERNNITDAVTVNGLLDPIERAKSLERVENGSASLLYISPKSLRSRTIERLLLGRNVVRFVIDEAHCFSTWGQDFRVDYLYIGDFIKNLQEKKNLDESIPVSCFTATAKLNVIEDIREYFKNKLSLDLQVYSTSTSRKNLHYKVYQKDNEEDKYTTIRNLIDEKKCPTIIYVSRTKASYKLAKRLSDDGYIARPYHGKMDKQEKIENQDSFMRGETDIIVATSAFGMGVDKKDVGLVIHYDISDSLENYVQEAGRAGRDQSISADCYVLFNDEDLNKHFVLLNQTKMNINEIKQIWSAIKSLTRYRSRVSQSALELARKAGWDDNIKEVETRVTTAIAALEEAGYIKRGQNMPRIYANSILAKNAQEAIDRINVSDKFDENEKKQATRIIKKLFSSKSKQLATDESGESRIDYISDHLGIEKEEVIHIINLLREERILADAKDLTAFIKRNERKNRSLNILESYWEIEKFLMKVISDEEKTFHIKELNEQAELVGCKNVTPNKLKTTFNIWSIKNIIKRKITSGSNNHIAVMSLYDMEKLEKKLSQRYKVAHFIVDYLFNKSNNNQKEDKSKDQQILVEFSVLELKESFNLANILFKEETTLKEVEEALFYLSRIEAIKIEGNFLIVYNRLTIERLEKDNKKQYKADDYKKLKEFYQNKIQQIHIVGEYAHKMIENYKEALSFVEDYFQLNYSSFLRKYFRGSRLDEIKKNITPEKFKQLFGELSPAQLDIVKDKQSKYIVVLAGPGSGKTRILVHKLASLLLMEDVKHEQLLMVTFSRSAATEFKKRLIKLIGNSAYYVEIKTFHSYCFDLLGRIGSLEKSADVINEAIRKIKSGEVEPGRITKTVLVIDEAQDMDENEFLLVKTLMEYNDDMRVIAVGDDDQNIYEFRGSSSKYLEKLISEHEAKKYELVENYRSRRNLVDYTNKFVLRLSHRLKTTPIYANNNENGNINVVHYKSENLIIPLVNYVMAENLSGTTCILTNTNDEAFKITGILLNNGLNAKLIQTNDGFNLYNLLEIRYFIKHLNLTEKMYIIDEDQWSNAKIRMFNRFRHSTNLELCINIIKEFQSANIKYKYKSDLEVFIRESKIEDFLTEKMDTIYVSTMHKSKGREFKNVFIMLDKFRPHTDEKNRQLYVAMTRAKTNLTIHYNDNYLSNINTENLNVINDYNTWKEPKKLGVQLSFKDVWLDHFINCQESISKMTSGDKLKVNDKGCCDNNGKQILRFSKRFTNRLESIKSKGYMPMYAKIRFIIFWKKEDTDKEILIILPEIYFENK